VDDPGPGRHPLHAAGIHAPGVAHAVPVFDPAREHGGHGLDPPVGVPGEPGEVVLRPFCPEIIEHQERVKERELGKTKCPPQPDTGPLDGLARGEPLCDLPVLWHDRGWVCEAMNVRDEGMERNPVVEGILSPGTSGTVR